MAYYSKHVFFCCNEREAGAACCNNHDAAAVRDYAKKRVKELGLAGPGKVRINQSGCLDRCDEGPCLVVYPEAVWYTYVDRADVDEIIGDKRICKVSVVGIGMRSHVGIASKMFKALADEGINIQMISTSEIKITVVIEEKYTELAVRVLHRAFELDQA